MGREMAWIQAKLFLVKVLWSFDVSKIEGQDVNLENSLLHYGFFEKRELRVRFVSIT
jgi:hypothetical protein